MVVMIRSRIARLGGFVLVALVAVPARAGDVDRFMPEDTEIVVKFNVHQMVESKLAKRLAADASKDGFPGEAETAQLLKDLGFDPDKDLDTVTLALPLNPGEDKGLVIAHGRFDLDKFKKKAEETAKDNGDVLKIHKSGNHALYEVKFPVQGQEVTLFVALPNKETVLVSPGKDYVVDALKKDGAKKNPGLKNKQVQTLVEKIDANQTLAVATTGDFFAKFNFLDANTKALLAKCDAVSGGLTVTDGVKLEIGVTMAAAADAKQLTGTINDFLNTGLGLLALAAAKQKELQPVLDFVKTVKATAKDKTVLIRGEMNGEAIDKALGKKDKDF
jgi:hypothetical protein